MEKRVKNQGRPATATTSGARCSSCDRPTYNVCQNCSGLTFFNGAVAFCPPPKRAEQPAVVPPKIKKEENPPQGEAGNSGTSFRTMLRRGGKMMEQLSKNVAFATDLFGHDEEEEDIDKAVEEFKKTQVEEQEKNKKF